ncbi:SIMPL domain-containing protein [Croceimicrobium hydrocarbonivorans]|uniref:SIMPL domain-containing protein n=1 Tax=Croceimicrobium hydrocarbonivorans TaxID=2761580 RepID=A0A7H0VHG4_9FLAO|nr:SIMPL domain-containing protein [Croceimicrobium hydrocarbonivorans]QNR25162.1 SIMPL domain-containing protein [Croceimicrobium hydrocarbonivorans]
MKKVLLVVLALIANGALGQITEQAKATGSYIEVVATATETVLPDKILIEVTLKENGKSGAKEPISSQEKQLIKGLDSLNIPSSRLSKEGARTNFVKINWFNEKQISQAVYILELKNSQEISTAFTLFQKLKVEHAILYESTHTQLDSIQEEVEVKAIIAAKNKAKRLVQALGSDLGEPILITQNEPRGNGVYFIDGIKVRGSVQIPNIAYDAPFIEQEPYIEIQKLKIEASILVRFEIK